MVAVWHNQQFRVQAGRIWGRRNLMRREDSVHFWQLGYRRGVVAGGACSIVSFLPDVAENEGEVWQRTGWRPGAGWGESGSLMSEGCKGGLGKLWKINSTPFFLPWGGWVPTDVIWWLSASLLYLVILKLLMDVTSIPTQPSVDQDLSCVLFIFLRQSGATIQNKRAGVILRLVSGVGTSLRRRVRGLIRILQ